MLILYEIQQIARINRYLTYKCATSKEKMLGDHQDITWALLFQKTLSIIQSVLISQVYRYSVLGYRAINLERGLTK